MVKKGKNKRKKRFDIWDFVLLILIAISIIGIYITFLYETPLAKTGNTFFTILLSGLVLGTIIKRILKKADK